MTNAVRVARAIALVGLLSCACHTTAPVPDQLVVHDERGAVRYAAPAAFTVRPQASGAAQRVVSLRGLGEVVVSDERCVLVLADANIHSVRVLRSTACEWKNDRLCFSQAHFVEPGQAGQGFVVDGCASEGRLVAERLHETQTPAANIAPPSATRRCIPIAEPRCQTAYLRARFVTDNSGQPQTGVRLEFVEADEAWRVCFWAASSTTPPFSAEVEQHDGCGHHRVFVARTPKVQAPPEPVDP